MIDSLSFQFSSFASQVDASLQLTAANQELMTSQLQQTLVATSLVLSSNLTEFRNESSNFQKTLINFASDVNKKIQLLESSILGTVTNFAQVYK